MDNSKKAKCSSESVAMDSSASSSRQALRQGPDLSEVKKDLVPSRKVQKADREKLRRDRLNEQFLELGNTLDPDRPKSDKASILTDTIQMLKDLMTEVNTLKVEYAALSEESRELMLEKNELREEKASLKSDIESLNDQYQHRVRTMVPWAPIDPSLVMGPPHYSYPIPVAITQGPISVHPPLQPFPFFGSQNPTVIPNPCSTFIPYSASACPPTEQASLLHPSSSDTSNASNRQDSESKSLNHRKNNRADHCDDHKHVALELELKTPGPSAEQFLQDISRKEKKGKQAQQKERSLTTTAGSSSRCSSSQVVQDSYASSVNDISKS